MIHGSAIFDDVHYCEAKNNCTIEPCIEIKYGHKRHRTLLLVFSTAAYRLKEDSAWLYGKLA